MQVWRLRRQALLLTFELLVIHANVGSAQGGRGADARTRSPIDEVWVAFDYSNSVTAYSTLTAIGGMRPRRTIAGDHTGLHRPSAAAVDGHGALYVSNAGNNSVTVYARGASGNVSPVRTLRGPATGLATPRGLAIDAHGRLYVANAGRDRLTVYAPHADGDAVPIRSIWGSRTRLRSPSAIAVDQRGAMFVTGRSMGYILVFAPGTNGNARPARDFRSTAYGPVGMKSLSWRGVSFPTAITFDRAGRLYVVDYGQQYGPEIQVYPHNARGITASLRTVRGDRTGLAYPMGVAVDTAGYVYVLNESPTQSITAYAPGAVGDAAPVVTLDGDASGRPRPSPWDRAARDSTRSPPSVPPAVAIFPAGASGDVAPRQEITGARTGLRGPVTLTVSGDGAVYVLDCDARVRIYAPDADGDAAPVREFGRVERPDGASPTGLALDRRDTAFVSFVTYGEGVSVGWTEVYDPASVRGSPPRRRIDSFAASYNGLTLDTLGFLYAGLGESGFLVMHRSQQVASVEFGIGSAAAPRAPDADPATPEWDPYPLFLSGPDNELFGPGAFALDSRRRLHVPNRDDAVRIYGMTAASSRLHPMRTVTGPRTELDQPVAAAIGPGDTLYVANAGSARGPSLTVYPPEATGDVPPVRVLRGGRTGLGATGALAVDATSRLYVLRKLPPEKGCPAATR